MVCIARRPRCGTAESESVPEPLTDMVAVFLFIAGLISALIAVGKALGAVTVSASGVISVGGVTLFGAAGGAAVSAALTAIVAIVFIGLYAIDRCTQGEGLPECVAGVVHAVEESFSSAWDEIFPFTAMHDRVDVIAKSRYWDVIESGEAFVHCTVEPTPRRSEIMRCYFFDSQVCSAAKGALLGGIAGGVAGVLIAAAVIAAIGCSTVILCLFALLLAALIALAAVIVGALIGGQAGKALSEDDSPAAGSGETLGPGQLVTVNGNMQRREADDDANVIYWASSAQFHGNSASPQPFSYCEIDDELVMDGCPRPPSDIR
jgi:hypothetical protein